MYQVVIVEDNPMVSMLNRTFAERDKRFHVVHEFADGRAALSFLMEHPVDLAILDVFLPVLTGLELLRQLRAQAVCLDVVMVTAAHDTQTLDALLRLGVLDYLVKPFTQARFHQALDAFCQHRDAIAAGGNVNQSEIDRLLFAAPGVSQAAPKGLQEKTLAHIRGCLDAAGPEGHTSEEIAALAGLSVVTARRYLNYLLEHQAISSRVNYSTGGRPSMLYSSLNAEP